MMKPWRWLLIKRAVHMAVLLAVLMVLPPSSSAAQPAAAVSGFVYGTSGPVSGARVRIRATENSTLTLPDGSFALSELVEGQEVEVTAWADGYYIAAQRVIPPASLVELTLRPYHTSDHPDYVWADPLTCDSCHPSITPQWSANAHGGAISNPRFFSLYNGTDITGTAAVSPGYKLDFPETSGSCAACHAPGAGVDGIITTDMNPVRDSTTAGIHCDYCHKIGGIYLNPATGSVYSNAPGVVSQRMLRPPAGEDIFFGPYDDIKDPDTYLPEMRESSYCAPCHQFSFWGIPIYQSYSEWLNSPYAASGITCQTCHMPPNGDHYFALPEKGGLWHPAKQIPSHQDLGLKDTAFMTATVAMTMTVRQELNTLLVEVTLLNAGAGHHVPTDHPGRHMILTVQAAGSAGALLAQTGGSQVPEWGGDQAGQPGAAYAKILRDSASGVFPVVSYWKQTNIVIDNRLPALGSDTTLYRFALPPGGGRVTVTAELRFRRLFQVEMEARGWMEPDILLGRDDIDQEFKPYNSVFLPSINK